MNRRGCFFFTLATMLCVAVLSSCIPSTPKEAGQEVLAEWLAFEGKNELNPEEAMKIAEKLHAAGPEGIQRLVERLGSPEISDTARVNLTAALSPWVGPEHRDALLALLKPDRPSTTRGCAAHLLCALYYRAHQLPGLEQQVMDLLRDPDSHTRMSAILALEVLGHPKGVQEAIAAWKRGEGTPRERAQILLGLPTELTQIHQDIVVEAALDTRLPENARRHALELLSKLGNASAVGPLEEGIAKEQNAELAGLMREAADAITKRAEEGVQPVVLGPDGKPYSIAPAPAQPEQGAGKSAGGS